jgi:hypothetical protein
MSVSLSTFRAAFPEFKTAPDALVLEKLGEAAIEIKASVWGDFADKGQKYLAAHLIASSPYGGTARLTKDGQSTTYLLEWNRLKRIVSSGFRVTG